MTTLSIEPPDVRRFLQDHTQYCAALRLARRAPQAFYTFIDRNVLDILPDLARHYADAALPPIEELAGAADLHSWEATVRATFDAYLTDPSLTDDTPLADLHTALQRAVRWNPKATVFRTAYFNFKQQWLNHLRERGDAVRSRFFYDTKSQRRTVTALLAQLHPASWRAALTTRFTDRPYGIDEFFDHLYTQEEAWKGYMAHADDSPAPSSSSSRDKGKATSKSTSARAPRDRDGPPPSPCARCGGNHWRKDCNRQISRPCKHCQGDHLDSVCRKASSGSAAPPTPAATPSAPVKAPAARGATGSGAGAGSAGRGPPPSPCKHCGSSAHWNSDCPKRPPASKPAVQRLGVHSHGTIFTNGAFAPFCLDTGSDLTVLGHSQARRLAGGIDAAVTPLPEPLVANTAKAGEGLTFTHALHLPAAEFIAKNGTTVHLCNLTFYVSHDMATDDVLVGRDLLAQLGPAMTSTLLHPTVPPTPPPAVLSVSVGDSDSITDDDPLDPLEDVPGPDYGDHDPTAVRNALLAALNAARAAGLSVSTVNALAHLVLDEFAHVFRLTVGPDPPAKVPPVRPVVDESQPPPKPRARRMGPDALEYMRLTIDRMVADGLLQPAFNATYASPAYAVPKPGASSDTPIARAFRMVVDYRAVNALTTPIVDPLPHPDVIRGVLAGKSFIGTADMTQGFHQLEYHEDVRHFFNILTPRGVYTPTRLMMGCTDGPGPFQSAVHHALSDPSLLGGDLTRIIAQFIDDLAVTAHTEAKLVEAWRMLLQRLSDYNFKLHPGKLVFFARYIIYLGRQYGPDGVSYDPAAVQAFARLPQPPNAQALVSFIATCNWFRDSVPSYAERIAPLHKLLQAALAGLKSSRAARERRLLTDLWQPVHTTAFADIVSAISNATSLSHPNDDLPMYVLTDASTIAWAGVIVQPHPDDIGKPLADQRLSPLAFYSGLFRGAQLRWATCDLEAYAIVSTLDKGAFLLRRRLGFTLMTDSRNLVYVFGSGAASTRPLADRLERWAVRLRAFKYSIHHIDGEANVCADLLTRWGAPAREPPSQLLVRALTRQQRALAANPAPAPAPAPVPAASAPAPVPAPAAASSPDSGPAAAAAAPLPRASDFGASTQILFTPMDDMPTAAEVIVAQHATRAAERPPRLHQRDGDKAWVTSAGALWVPDTQRLRVRLAVCAHAGLAGHHGVTTTIARLTQYFWWDTIPRDITTFVNACIHCLSVRGGAKVPRPLGHQIRATRPQQWLHMDYLYISPAGVTATGDQYILTLIDAFSKYTMLTACPAADSASAINALLRWFSTWGVVTNLTSDQGAHFTSTVFAALTGRLGIRHHFTTAYCPFANGLVERANKTVLQHLRAICSEARLTLDQWPDILPVVQGIINASPCRALDGLAPVTVHCGMPPGNPLHTAFLPDAADYTTVSSPVSAVSHATALQEELLRLHARVRSVPPRPHPTRPGEQPINFGVGDFVLVSSLHGRTQGRHKLECKWFGPQRIIAAPTPYTFTVQDLESGVETDVHAQHLKFYSDRDLTVTPQLLKFAAHSALGHIVTAITDHTLAPPRVLVHWAGYSAEEATWEPLPSIYETNRADVRRYANAIVDRASRRALLDLLKSLDPVSASD